VKHRPQGHQDSTKILILRRHIPDGSRLGASLRSGCVAGEHLARGWKLRVF
jgi:hypothetical protein